MLGVLLLAALTLAPWHTGGPKPTEGGAYGITAIQAPDAVAGVLAALAAAGGVIWLATATLVTKGFNVPHPRARLQAFWLAALGLAVVKLATGFNHLAIGAWASIGLGLVLVGAHAVSGRPLSAS